MSLLQSPVPKRIHYHDNKGSGLVMYSDYVNGTYSARKTLTPGRLTDAQRLADTELVLVAGAQISCTDTGVLWESNGSVWVVAGELTGPQSAAVQALVSGAGLSGAVFLTVIQSAIDRFGSVRIPGGLGTVQVPGSIVLPSDSSIEVGAGTIIQLGNAVDAPLLINKYCGLMHSGTDFSRAVNVATVLEKNTIRAVGDKLWINNATDTTFNGLATVASVSSGGYTYANTGNAATTAGAKIVSTIPVRQTIAGSAFVRSASGYVVVADVGHNKKAGQHIHLATDGASTNYTPGVVVITAVSADGWVYNSGTAVADTATGSIYLSWDSNIRLTGAGEFNGNRLNNAVGTLRASTVGMFGCVSNLLIDCRIGGAAIRGVNIFNSADVTLGRSWAGFDNLVAAQFEGGGTRLVVEQGASGDSQTYSAVTQTSASGQAGDDYVAFTGVKPYVGGAYDFVASPYGLSGFYNIDVRSIHTNNSLNGVKLTADVSCPYAGKTRIGKITGRLRDNAAKLNVASGVSIIDDGVSLTGCLIDDLIVDSLEWTSPSSSNGVYGITVNGAMTIRKMRVNGARSVTQQIGLLNVVGTPTISSLVFDNLMVDPLGSGKPNMNLAGGTLRYIAVTNSLLNCEVTTGTPIYINGAAVGTIALLNNVYSGGSADGTGTVVQIASGTLANLRINGATNRNPSANRLGSFYTIQAAVTTNVRFDNTDMVTGSAITTPSAGTNPTLNVKVGNVRWGPAGGGNFLQLGTCTCTLLGGPGFEVTTTDRIALFGFGTPAYRIHLPGNTEAPVNMNGANYGTGMSLMQNGDELYNNNAGVLGVGRILRRAGAWAPL